MDFNIPGLIWGGGTLFIIMCTKSDLKFSVSVDLIFITEIQIRIIKPTSSLRNVNVRQLYKQYDGCCKLDYLPVNERSPLVSKKLVDCSFWFGSHSIQCNACAAHATINTNTLANCCMSPEKSLNSLFFTFIKHSETSLNLKTPETNGQVESAVLTFGRISNEMKRVCENA